MKTAILKYHQRLGDVIRLLPAALHLHRMGYTVFIECLPRYHRILDAVSYAHELSPNHAVKADLYLDLEIWPDKYDDYRRSKLKWMDYVYSHPAIHEADRRIVFDRLTGSNRSLAPNLICPFGHSHITRHRLADILELAYGKLKFAPARTALLVSPGTQVEHMNGVQVISASSLRVLVETIRDADRVLTINTSTAIIASAVRTQYDHIYEPAFNGQDDTADHTATVHHLTAEP